MCENIVNPYETPQHQKLPCLNDWVCGFISPIEIGDKKCRCVDMMNSGLEIKSASTESSATLQKTEEFFWVCEYAVEIFQSLLESEKRRKNIFFQSTQYSFRPALIGLMKTSTVKYSLSRTTLHLAVYLLDCFMDTFTIRIDKLNLTAISCLILAAKLEETDSKIPKFSQFNLLSGNEYSLAEFKQVECKILTTFDFDLICPTAATFAEYFANRCVSLDDFDSYTRNSQINFQNVCGDQLYPEYTSYNNMITVTRTHLFEVIDLSLDYVKFCNTKPSVIAASCVAVVRKILNITPYWTLGLAKLTTYTEEIISPFVEALVALRYIYAKPQACNNPGNNYCNPIAGGALCYSPDSGIASDTKSDSEDESYSCLEYPFPKRKRFF